MIDLSSLPGGMDARSASVLREIVEQYMETGDPVASRTLAQRLTPSLSSATIRNVMAELTQAGLLFSLMSLPGVCQPKKGFVFSWMASCNSAR